MVHRHWFRDHPAFIRATMGFVVLAALLYLIFGPIGILCALGFAVVYLLTMGFAALLDPDVY
jgi:hypothetical protein